MVCLYGRYEHCKINKHIFKNVAPQKMLAHQFRADTPELTRTILVHTIAVFVVFHFEQLIRMLY